MDTEQKEKQLEKLVELLKLDFSEEELQEMKYFFDKLFEILAEVYPDRDLSE